MCDNPVHTDINTAEAEKVAVFAVTKAKAKTTLAEAPHFRE